MITLETHQQVLLEPHWIVLVGGNYAPDDLVECKKAEDYSQRCAFYALFIATGENPA